MKQTAVVIIPTYNERENITTTIEALLAVFKTISDWKMFILVVDDTSPDKTYEVVRQVAAKNKQVHLLLNKKKSGLGGAYLKGMEYAFGTLQADAVFEFDADLSHDPQRIPAFLKQLHEGADMVLGSRYIQGGSIPSNWGAHRKLLSIGGNTLITVVLGNRSIRDWTTGYRALTKDVYLAVEPHLHAEKFTGYTFQIGFLHTAIENGFRVVEVPIHFVDRAYGESKIGPEYITNTLRYIVRVRASSLIKSRFFKFMVVGAIGAAVQLVSLQVLRVVLPEFSLFHLDTYMLASIVSIELAVLSNFILNNTWTFADRKLQVGEYVQKFFQFNMASLGSIGVQLVIAFLGKTLIGLKHLFTVPLIGISVDTGLVFAVVGILVGMAWNFFAYTTFIWKKK
ncbi:MAG: glycosyltransferase family 2 protein [Pseudomonadales bacterium]|nr:glycosyltransferase family 2 protein [Candidatus Woesebacteria bacterium]MCB9802225.1 glycosyltransferase family 2 protein [Pseudomonadales bacterium]